MERYRLIIFRYRYFMSQLTFETRQPKPQNSLVESIPVKKGSKLSTRTAYPFTPSDMMGLSWIFFEEDW